MNETADERFLKKKLRVFLLELWRFATVKGFQHVAMYLRGREELVLSIPNNPIVPDNTYCQPEHLPLSQPQEVSPSSSLTSANLPYDKRSLMLSQRTQRQLSGFGHRGVGLPPASPSEDESNKDSNSTLFLLAGYGRYSSPYVWVRTNHDRIVRITGVGDKDSPLRLKSTSNWKNQDTQVWHIIAELVKLNMYPVPANPFAVDFSYFEGLPVKTRILASAAMINALHKVLLYLSHTSYISHVQKDLHRMTVLHFTDIQKLQLKN